MKQKLLPLRKRSEFLAVRNGEKRRGALFLLELKKRPAAAGGDSLPPRIGFTVTRKNGNAVCRNRIKRRLREAVRLGGIAELAAPQTDYVIIARIEALDAPFPRLMEELRRRIGGKGAAGKAAPKSGAAKANGPDKPPA